jgi:hypothetical protein
MAEVYDDVDGQLELLLPPNGGHAPTRPSDIGLLELSAASLQCAQPTPDLASHSYAFRLGGADFSSAARRVVGTIEPDDPVLVYVSTVSVTMIAGTGAGAPVTYSEEYSAATVGIPERGLFISLKGRVVAALAAFDAVFDVVVDLKKGTFVAQRGPNCVRRSRLLPIDPSAVPHILTPVANGTAGGGQELVRQLSRAIAFAAKDKTYHLDRVVVESGAAKACNIDTLAEIRHGHFGQVSYEIARAGNGQLLKALAHLPASVTVMTDAGAHLLGAEGRVVLWKAPRERVERDRLDSSQFKSTMTLVVDRQEMARTLAIFGAGRTAARPRIGLRLVGGETGAVLWLESNHPEGIVCTYPHPVTVEEAALDLPSDAFFVDHVQFERVVAWTEAESLKIEIYIRNGVATVIRVPAANATYLLGTTKVPNTSAPKQRRYQSR